MAKNNKEYLQEAFRSLDVLGEDIFDVDDVGVKELTALRTDDAKANDEIEIIDPEASSDAELQDTYVGKIILMCPVCHSFIFKNKKDIDIDKISELANVTEECPYCCSVGGFNIVGQVTDYSTNDGDEVKETEEVKVEIPAKEEAEETTEETAEETVEEGLETDTEKKTDEGILGKVLSGGLPSANPIIKGILGDSLDKNTDEKTCQESVEEKPVDESVLGTLALAAGAGAVGGIANAITKKALGEDEKTGDVTEEIKTVDADDITVEEVVESDIIEGLNAQLGIDSWTNFSYDDEDSRRVIPIKVYNGTEELGSDFYYNKDSGEILTECEDVVNEDLTVSVDDAATTVTDTNTNKTITVVDKEPEAESAEEEPVAAEEGTVEVETEQTEEGTVDVEDNNEEDKSADVGETVEPLTDEEKETIEKEDEEEEDEEEEDEEEEEAVENKKSVDEVEVDTEADVAEVEEESFNRLGERFLKRTYENVDSFKLNDAVTVGNTLQLEGVIRFKSGKERSTRFILEAKDMTPEGRVRFIGENKQLCTAKKAFTVSGKLSEGKFIAESLNYNYSAKDKDGKSTRVYGTVSNRK